MLYLLQKYTAHPHDAILFGVGFSLDEGMIVDALAPGCSADKSGSVQVGDYVAAVDGKTDLSPTQAKEMILGRQGTYATISFRRPEGANVRMFKVQLMRGSADYIFLVECLRGLEHQISDLEGQVKDLEAENYELRNAGPKSAPASNGATNETRAQMIELQSENERLKSKHRDEIQDLLVRIEDIENRNRSSTPKSAPESNSNAMDEMRVQIAQLQAENEWLKSKQRDDEENIMLMMEKESKKVQRSAAPPRSPPQQKQEPQYILDPVPIIEFDSEENSPMNREKRSVQRSVRVLTATDGDAV